MVMCLKMELVDFELLRLAFIVVNDFQILLEVIITNFTNGLNSYFESLIGQFTILAMMPPESVSEEHGLIPFF